jgi:MYXO-CTERM domain-containing protein
MTTGGVTSAGASGVSTGGTSAGGSGAPVATGTAPQTAADAGCGCQVPGQREASAAGLWLALAGLIAARQRRSRQPA